MTQEARPETTLNRLDGQRIALTGTFAAMTQRQLSDLIQQQGGETVSQPGRHTSIVIVGAGGPPLGPDGQPSQGLKKAKHLRACGYDLQILSEEQFLEKLGVTDSDDQIRQRYTVAQLSRILAIPCQQIRRWVRCGLIEPVETVHRLDYFDYSRVNSAKVLFDLVSEGLPLGRIRESLQRVQGWLPNIEAPLSQLSVLEANGRLLIRLADGRLAEPSGQLQLDFEPSDETEAFTIQSAERTTDDWFQEALDCENRGDYGAATHAYRRAVELEPDDPILRFNLGNVLYASYRLKEAEVEFREAVQLDPEYVEAWNNLGTVLADLDCTDAAVQAFERALQVFPLYADAHFNLGDVLSSAGRQEEAHEHWQKYLYLDPKSPWADDLRTRLRDLQQTQT